MSCETRQYSAWRGFGEYEEGRGAVHYILKRCQRIWMKVSWKHSPAMRRMAG